MAEHYIDVITDAMRLAFKIKGKEGPIKINIALADHNIYLDDTVGSKEFIQKLFKDDIIIVGEEGEIIKESDLEKFIIDMKKNLKYFDNGRSYFFEGISKINHKEYRFRWGS